MTTIKEAMLEACEYFIDTRDEGCIVDSSEIREFIGMKYSMNKNSLLPSDFCYNRINDGISVDHPAYFEYMDGNKYRCWGENYPFNGQVFHKEKHGEEIVVGECINGMKMLFPEHKRDISFEDISEDIVIIKINRHYREDMNAEELYDVTRGCWKRKKESLQSARYVLSVYYGMVMEAYTVFGWYDAEEETRNTIPYVYENDHGRIIFKGELAPQSIRDKYVGKSVKGLFKKGEADPVKLIKAYRE